MSKQRSRSIAIGVVLFCVACAGAVVAFMVIAFDQGQKDYDRLTDLAFDAPLEVDPSLGELQLSQLPAVNWAALLAENPDAVGWIYVPGTKINYPVAHSHDNDEYLYRNFSGEYANGLQPAYGTPFLMAQSAADFSDAVNIIQAHNMSNGTMFADIPKTMLADQEAYDAHRVAYLLTPTCNYLLLSIAGFSCGPQDSIVRLDVNTQAQVNAYVRELAAKSEFKAHGPMPTLDDVQKVVLLSTCTSDGSGLRRIVGYAVVAWEPVE